MKFKGDILITDPCYIIKEDNNNDWSETMYGNSFNILGINNYFTEGTGVGDGSWCVYEAKSKKVLGEFCADSGQTSVFNLSEVEKYNPNIREWIKSHNWCATVIEGFVGEIETEYTTDGTLKIIGKGNINFFTA